MKKHLIRKVVIGAIAIIAIGALTVGCQTKADFAKEENPAIDETAADVKSADGVESNTEYNGMIKDIIFYEYPTAAKIPSIKTIDSTLEETALTPSLDAPNPGGWEETCYVYPFDDNGQERVKSDKQNYISLLMENGFVRDEKGFYMKDNVGVTCELIFTNVPGGELTVFIFENFDRYKSNDDFSQRSFSE